MGDPYIMDPGLHNVECFLLMKTSFWIYWNKKQYLRKKKFVLCLSQRAMTSVPATPQAWVSNILCSCKHIYVLFICVHVSIHGTYLMERIIKRACRCIAEYSKLSEQKLGQLLNETKSYSSSACTLWSLSGVNQINKVTASAGFPNLAVL